MGCLMCPRKCGADREYGAIGVCGAGGSIKAARAGIHMWEEPCISGKSGSGAIFFSGCPMGCVFCQNSDISHRNFGAEISPARLAEIFREIEERGVNNINLVSPTPYCAEIINALDIYKPKIPIVYNTSGYERVETLEKIDPYVDIYIPDLKYFSPEISQKYSGAADYFEYASKAILYMLSKKPKSVLDDFGIMKSGVIIRHLLLPSNIRQTYLIIDWLQENIPRDTFISLMSQYFPAGEVESSGKFPELNRAVTSGEYSRASDYLYRAGFECGYLQEKTSAKKEFVPEFDLTGILKR